MKKRSLVIGCITILASLALSGCSSKNDKTVEVSENTVTSETEKAPSKEESKSKIGKRSNPVPLGQTATFDTSFYGDDGKEYDANLSLTLSNVIRGEEAMTYLTNANQFNEPAPEGNEWIIFQVDEKLNKGDVDVPFYESGFLKVINPDGAELDQSVYATLVDGDTWGWADMYEGASLTGKHAIYAPIGEDILVEYTGNDFSTSVFFALK